MRILTDEQKKRLKALKYKGGKHINPRCKISMDAEERALQGAEAERLGFPSWASWVKACLHASRIRGSV